MRKSEGVESVEGVEGERVLKIEGEWPGAPVSATSFSHILNIFNIFNIFNTFNTFILPSFHARIFYSTILAYDPYFHRHNADELCDHAYCARWSY